MTAQKQETGSIPRYWSIKQVVENGLYPSEAGLRQLVFKSSLNGLDSAVRRVNRRVLINVDKFVDWVESQN